MKAPEFSTPEHPGLVPAGVWCHPEAGLVRRLAELLGRHRLHAARVVVLVPYAPLMRVGREMWARCGPAGFVPRFETSRTWARAAGDFAPDGDDFAFDRARDLLTAQSLLARTGLAARQAALAPRLVDIALQLAPLASAVPLSGRAAWGAHAGAIVAGAAGLGESPWFALETMLAHIAVAWVSASGYATDALLDGAARSQVDALVVLQGPQAEPLHRALAALFGERAFELPLADAQAPAGRAALHEADDAEDEAERAAACVLRQLALGRAPVALAAIDRALTRRIRPRLEAHGASIHDETGWRLSTTRAAATLMAALRACAGDASGDAVLDWLKGVPVLDTGAVRRLEARLRRLGLRSWADWCTLAAVATEPGDGELRELTHAVEALRMPLAAGRALADWLRATQALLHASGQWSALAADRAGATVIDALGLTPEAAARLSPGAGLRPGGRRIGPGEFRAWVREVLEAVNFLPEPPQGPPDVVVLPLYQLVGRGFGAVVVAGCDDQRLPAVPELAGSWSAEQRAALGLPSRDDAAAAQRAAWRAALQAPQCELLWRRADAGGEPVRRSPLVQLLELGGGAAPASEPRQARQRVAQPTPRPRPRGDRLPVATLSASAYEDLRRCPYRFFALRQLGLGEADELDAELGKRDFGNWLHTVLGHFHEALKRSPAHDLSARRALVSRAAERATRELALSEAEFTPFAAAWPAVRDGYLDWLARHEAREGAVFCEAEVWKEQPLGALRLAGRIDRIDRLPDGRAFLIDYKTESIDASRKRVRQPGEDTQLAFYAALLDDDTLRAAYVSVGEKSGGTAIAEQHDVVGARDALLEGIQDDFGRIAAGAELPALGEGSVCEHCAARGLCRKDFWKTDEASRLATACASPPPEGAARSALGRPGGDRITVSRSAARCDASLGPAAVDAAPDKPAQAAAAGVVPPQAAFRHNGELVARERFYQVACDPRRSVAVEACAGAGKTWMLVSRMVRALLEEGEGACEPQEILAITFTKKAAGEMGERLDEWLQRFAHQESAQLVPELRMRGLGAAAAQAAAPRLQALYRRLLEGGRAVQIRTFHGWFAGLLRHAPLVALERLGLPPVYQLLEEEDEARRLARPLFFAALRDDPAAAADYQALVDIHGRTQSARALDEALTRRVEFTLADAEGRVDAGVRTFAAQHPALAGLDAPHELLRGAAARARWLAWAQALGAEKNKTPQKAAAAVVEVFGAGPLESGAAAWPALRRAFFVADADRLNSNLAKFPAAQEAGQELQLLGAAQAQHEAWLHQRRMARLTRRLVAAYAEAKRRNGWIDMNDVEAAAHLLLSDPVLSGWLQERLDARVRHLLIDEFQDTNPTQWQALYAWLSGYAGAGGRMPSIFLVGDPKQSIYRFRRAEPQVFVAAQRFVADELGGDRLSCDHTHRNAPGVLGLVNGVMRAAQEAGEFSGFREHTTESRAGGVALALPAIERDAAGAAAAADDGDGDEEDDGEGIAWRDSLTTPRVLPEERLQTLECRQAARWIAARIAEGVAPSEIMVLARKRAPLGVLQDELRALHIAVQQPEKNDLNDAPEVRDLVALLDVLVSPGHDLSLARALRSPLFGQGDDALVELALLQRQARAACQARAAAVATGASDAGTAGDAGDTADAGDIETATETAIGDVRGTNGTYGTDGTTGTASPPGDPSAGIVPSWFDLLQRDDAPPALADAGKALLRWRHWVDTLPPHDALAAIYHDGDVLGRFAAAVPAAQRRGVLANLRGLLAASLELDGARFATPYALVRALRAGGLRAPSVAAQGAVRLLTVHGAKGLEADTVLLLDCDGAPQHAQTLGVLVVWPGEKRVPERFVFVTSEKRPPACAGDALAEEQAARAREELNALYVATTRARARLVLSAVRASADNPRSWWSRLAPACMPDAAEDAAADPSGIPAGDVFHMLECPSAPARPGFVAIENIADQKADASAAVFGQAVHRLLEWARPGVALTPAQVRAAQREFLLDADAARDASAMAERIRAGAAAWAWDAAALDWHGNEVTLCHAGRTLRIDRLVRHRASAAWWVLDYKSAARPERDPTLIAQLRRYREAVRSACPGETVRAAFLTGQGELVVVE